MTGRQRELLIAASALLAGHFLADAKRHLAEARGAGALALQKLESGAHWPEVCRLLRRQVGLPA